MESDKTEKIKKIYNELEELKKEAVNIYEETVNFDKESTKAIKNLCAEETEVHKFIIKQELKNVDVIIDILKLTTSLSISILVASLSTNYFSVNIITVIGINLISIILLIIFIDARNSISLEGKKRLLEILKESTTATYDNMLKKDGGINLKLNDFNEKFKEQKEIIKDLKK